MDGSSATDSVLPSAGYGGCIDQFAPGGSIVSTWYTSDTATATLSGGSPASGFTAGVAALLSIPDYPGGAVFGSVTISGCAGVASARSRVEVHIVHTFIGDLTVNLVAPDGSSYRLHYRSGGGSDNIHQTYVVNLSSERRSGTWRLRVQDHARIDVGYIDAWRVTV